MKKTYIYICIVVFVLCISIYFLFFRYKNIQSVSTTRIIGYKYNAGTFEYTEPIYAETGRSDYEVVAESNGIPIGSGTLVDGVFKPRF